MAQLDLGDLLVAHLDAWWSTYRDRVEGLTDHEHLWTPVDGLTVHETEGAWIVDIGDREADPAPFASIAWRMWHIAVDCLDSYALRAFGEQSGPDDDRWYGTAAEALARTDAAWTCLRDNIAALDADALAAPLGEGFSGPYEHAPRARLALHAQAEVTHHGAEVGLLRDLYAARA